MKTFPNKKQWNKYSSLNKLKTLSFYSAIFILSVSIISYLSIMSKENLIKKIEVDAVLVNLEVINKLTNKKYKNIEESKIKIQYPKIKSFLSNDFISNINTDIKKNALNYLDEDIEVYEFNYSEGIITPNLISLLFEQQYYYRSAANANEVFLSININPITGKAIEFFDVFDARKNALSEIKSLLKKKNDCISSEHFNKQNYIPRFYLRNEGITFIFSEYEVSTGVCGHFKIEIEYPQILNLLRNDNPLEMLVSPSRNIQKK